MPGLDLVKPGNDELVMDCRVVKFTLGPAIVTALPASGDRLRRINL